MAKINACCNIVICINRQIVSANFILINIHESSIISYKVLICSTPLTPMLPLCKLSVISELSELNLCTGEVRGINHVTHPMHDTFHAKLLRVGVFVMRAHIISIHVQLCTIKIGCGMVSLV